jgi:hypothetical protein
LASTGRVRAGTYSYWRWNNYVFTASTETIANDQTSPPQGINSGGATWIAYVLSTTFVGISGAPPYEVFNFQPIWPGIPATYKTTLEAQARGAIILGDTLTFQSSVVVFNPNGQNTATPIGPQFKYNSTSAVNGYSIVPMAEDTNLDANTYPVVEIVETPSNWYVGRSTSYDPNLILTVTMWLQYIDPSGF